MTVWLFFFSAQYLHFFIFFNIAQNDYAAMQYLIVSVPKSSSLCAWFRDHMSTQNPLFDPHELPKLSTPFWYRFL